MFQSALSKTKVTLQPREVPMSSLARAFKNVFRNTNRRRAARASFAVEPMESRMLLSAVTVDGILGVLIDSEGGSTDLYLEGSGTDHGQGNIAYDHASGCNFDLVLAGENGVAGTNPPDTFEVKIRDEGGSSDLYLPVDGIDLGVARGDAEESI